MLNLASFASIPFQLMVYLSTVMRRFRQYQLVDSSPVDVVVGAPAPAPAPTPTPAPADD